MPPEPEVSASIFFKGVLTNEEHGACIYVPKQEVTEFVHIDALKVTLTASALKLPLINTSSGVGCAGEGVSFMDPLVFDNTYENMLIQKDLAHKTHRPWSFICFPNFETISSSTQASLEIFMLINGY